MEFSIKQIAQIIDAEIVGNIDAVINTVCKIENGIEGGLSFLANPKYTHYIYDTKATAVIVNKDFVPENKISTTLIKVENSYLAFAKLLNFYESFKPKKNGISKFSAISDSTKIGKNIYVGDFVSLGENVEIGNNVQIFSNSVVGDNVKIADNTIIYAGVKIYNDCIIGKNCTIHAGAVIGADGFGFANTGSDYLKIPQIGNVVIEDNVEIGANTCIDRATMGSTVIKKNVKLDNLVQIAHNVEIGENTGCAAQVGISGSTKIGMNCVFAGQVGVAGHISIGDNVMVGAQSGVSNSVKENTVILGTPAIPVMTEKKLIIYRKNLPELNKKINQIEQYLSLSHSESENNKK